ncbi:tRNA(Met) cytidine acetate ligase [Gemella cuniculi]|uniref:tRNA(Met) cytidine acetate ligase n=1 Tax=Gemella cuniculi TaxID=150240 RepID=UPI0003F4C1F1|nr:nucleotidyltransferase family protein [Gemella cuniculi]
MKIGIVAEFNPLHSGHKYLIEEARKRINKNQGGEIICVMSEYFTQRGEVAIVDGYARAKEAIREGCDLVIALPYLASVAYSDDFAKKSIEILADAGVTHLIFGTEQPEIEIFEDIYNKQENMDKTQYKELLKQGYNYATINNKLFGLENNNPNFVLAYSYYKAIKKYAPHIKLLPVKRSGQRLNENIVEENFHLSATTIRKNINDKIIENYLSENMLKELRENRTLQEEDFFDLIRYKIISLGKENLSEIYDINEGLENRIYEAVFYSEDYKNLVDNIATKRYSRKKVQRILLHILTNTTKEDYKKYFQTKVYKVLAVKKEKTILIREINNTNKITLISSLNSKNSHHFIHDIKVARIYNLISKEKDVFKKSIELV